MNATEPGFDACLLCPTLGSEPVEGRITVDRQRVRFSSDRLTEEIPLARVVIGLEKDGGRIHFHDAARPELKLFTVDQSLLEDRSFAQCEPLWSQVTAILTRREVWRRVRLSLYFLVGCGLVFWLGSLVFDLTARSVITRIPPEWEVKFGEDQMKKVRKVLTFEDDTNLVADLTVLAAPLMKTIPAGKVGFRFYVVDWRLPNAFALPGGHILVTSGLLEMADRPEQVLGVVAHEVAHVTQKHSFRQMISGGGPVLILKILLSDRNNNLNLLARRSGLLIYQTYSQQFELEADRMAWDYMVGANLDPHAMIEMLQMLKLFAPGDPRTDPFSSHPALDKRIAWLEEQWDKLPRKSGFVALTNQASAGPGRVMDPRLGRLFRKP